MIKHILTLTIVFGLYINIKAEDNLPMEQSKIDSIYNSLSLQQRIFSILIPNSSDNAEYGEIFSKLSINDFTIPHYLNMDSIIELSSQNAPLLSDHLIRSALLRGNNEELNAQFVNLLLRNKGEGFYYFMKSPYSLMFQEKDLRPTDFFLEPLGRIVLPHQTCQKDEDCFIANFYKLPENVLSNYPVNRRKDVLVGQDEVYMASLKWKELQNVLNEYEQPSLESILSLGGFIFSTGVKDDYETLLRIFSNKVLPEKILEKSCKKSILIRGLAICKPKVSSYQTIEDETATLIKNLYKKGAVLLENKQIIPINQLQNRKIASIHIGFKKESKFQSALSHYTAVDHFNIEDIPDPDQLLKLKKETSAYNTIIVGVNGDWYDKDKNSTLYSFLHQISSSADLILVHFGSGNRLVHLPSGHPFKAILLSYASDEIAQGIAAQIVFGGVRANGVLAKNINGTFTFGTGNFTAKSRLGYSQSYERAMPDTLSLIDKIVYKAIRERATPGCQVLVVQGGDIIYNKAFGYHTYQKRRHVKSTDLYDIASVTKIVSSVPSLMKMYDEGIVDVYDSLGSYLPRLINTNKSGLLLNDVLVHQAGLESWIPFYIRTIDKDRLKGDIYSKRYSSSKFNIKVDTRLYMNKTVRYRSDVFKHGKTGDFNIKVSDKWYMNKMFLDSIQMAIDTSRVKEDPEYRYSDLGYYFIKDIVEKKSGKGLDKYVRDNFYAPLGASKMGYLPLKRFSNKEIVPTENDVSWRNELIDGYVHDPGAAMLGGVGGHAGVFSNAEDLAKILQMYSNYGSYGGEHYIDSTTISLFTSKTKEGNRRGLGFDKPVLDPEKSGPCSKEASLSSYGHSGFTGTLVWVDPEYDLIYIFLSNRIHPNQYNKKLITDDVRTRIQSAIYRSLPEYWEKQNIILN